MRASICRIVLVSIVALFLVPLSFGQADPAEPPSMPMVEGTGFDGLIVLQWSNSPDSNNYLDAYRETDPLLSSGVTDDDYLFEGYEVIRFADASDQAGEVVATVDVVNGIGEDSGVQKDHRISGLANGQSYYFGVRAFAFNEPSNPDIIRGEIGRVEVIPSPRSDVSGAAMILAAEGREIPFSIEPSMPGRSGVHVRVVNPAMVVNAEYQVFFFIMQVSGTSPSSVISYDVYRGAEKIFDGVQAVEITGAAPVGRNVFLADGLSWSVEDHPADMLCFDDAAVPCSMAGSEAYAMLEVTGPGGLDPCGTEAESTEGCGDLGGNGVWHSLNSTSHFSLDSSGAGAWDSMGPFAPLDFEMRITDHGSYAVQFFSSGAALWVPLEIWDIGPTGPFGVNDPSDDIQLIVVLASLSPGHECDLDYGDGTDTFGAPATAAIYAYYSTTTYADWEARVKPIVDGAGGCLSSIYVADPGAADLIDLQRGRPIQRMILAAGPASAGAGGTLEPAYGSVIRLLTTKPFLPGEEFALDTGAYDYDGDGSPDGLAFVSTRTTRDAGLPDRFELSPAYPNPFNPRTTVAFALPAPSRVTMRAFDLLGRSVTVLSGGKLMDAGYHEIFFDGGELPSGLYFIRMQAGGFAETVPALLLK